MSGYLKRLAEYFEAAGIDHMILAGALWRNYNRIIEPLGPARQDYTLSPSQQQQLLAHFKKSLLIRYTDGIRVDNPSASWYAVICEKAVEFEEFNSHFRNKLRKSCKLCAVQQVDAEYIATHGYDVYMSAYTRYRNAKAPNITRVAYERHTRCSKDYPDVLQYWAVTVENQLAGYSVVIPFGKVEAVYDIVKLDPKFLKAYSSYALHFTMNKYYLQEQSLACVNNGFRSIAHATNIQELLIDYFGFRQVPTNLYVCYRPWLAAALSLPDWAKQWLAKHVHQYASLCTLDEARTRSAPVRS
jgi:hypothetical protein